MQGTQKQVEFATKVQAKVVALWNGAAESLQAAAAEGIEPAAAPIVADLIAYCRDVAAKAQAGEDAAFILDHNHTAATIKNVLFKQGFVQRLKDAMGANDGAQMADALADVMCG